MKKYKVLQSIGWLFITLQFVKYFSFDLNVFRTSISSNHLSNGFNKGFIEGFNNGYGFGKILFFNIHLFIGFILISISKKKLKELQSEIH
jgi:hypothetical protein